MLKIDTGLGKNMCSIEMKGTMIEITSELVSVVQGVYESFNKDDHMAGLVFLRDFMSGIEYIAAKAAKESDEKEKSNEAPDPMRLLALMSLLKAMQASQKNENKDIRSADFDSDEEFMKWFHGGDDE